MALMVAMAIGCGKKGDPVAHRIKQEAPAATLKLEKTRESVVLRWPIPQRQNENVLFQIEKSTLDPKSSDCPGCPRTFDVIAEISANAPACKESGNQQCLYEDYNVIVGYHYVYRLASCNSDGKCEGLSTPAEILY